ncbi:MAG TPA: hypothetical protein VKV20_19770 [Ktedonobacteraceae bacterium]|jgi:hypothetical protein|nr:hypothetical protein [Ktedonobacteraceae bacterium]
MEFATNDILEKALQNSAVTNFVLHLPRSTWKPGMVVVYVLREDQFPTYPGKEWRGKIKKACSQGDVLEVEVLDEGYEGLEDRVHFKQIVRVESE